MLPAGDAGSEVSPALPSSAPGGSCPRLRHADAGLSAPYFQRDLSRR